MSKYFDYVKEEITPEAIVLDLGCGNGEYDPVGKLNLTAKMIVGIDIDENLLRENKYIALKVIGDAHKLPFRDDIFDVVISRELIEHLENPDYVIEESARVLKKNGKIILQTPNKLNPISFLSSILSLRTRAFLKRIFTWEDKNEGIYETYYRCNTGSKLSRTLRKNGLVVEKLIYEGIGLGWVRNPLIKISLLLFQKLTNLPGFHIFKQQIICIAIRKS